MPNRIALYTLLAIAAVAWVALVLFTRFVPPNTPAALLAFFLVLLVALISSLTPFTFMLSKRLLEGRYYHVTIRQAIRQSCLLSLVVMLNLGLRALRSWNLAMAIVILAAAIIVEILFLARK
jgi:hypothetical protein